jgi:release factor glutamine methyltransferase
VANLKELIAQSVIDKIDTKVLLAHLCELHLGWSKSALISKDLELLSDDFVNNWHSLEQRRKNGEPIAYLIGKKGFYDIELEVNSSTLIPRPETEMLVDWAIEQLNSYLNDLAKKPVVANQTSIFRILDLGTGSGAIALAIAHYIQSHDLIKKSGFQIIGVDQSESALTMALKNRDSLGLQKLVNFECSNWYSNLDRYLESNLKFDLILSNPPYISKNDPHLLQGDLRFEPRSALTDEADGLDAYRLILKDASIFLKNGGLIAVEHGFDQGPELLNLFKQCGLSNPQGLKDLAGLDRITYGKLG